MEKQTRAPDTDAMEKQTRAPDTDAMEKQTRGPNTDAMEKQTRGPDTDAMEKQTRAPDTDAMEKQTRGPNTDAMEKQTRGPDTDAMEKQTRAPDTDAMEKQTRGPNTDAMEKQTRGPDTDAMEKQTRGPDTDAMEKQTRGPNTDAMEKQTRGPDTNAMEKQTRARPTWDNPVEFIMTCVSYMVGLGTLWRFPYLCQTHGGGSFLIPYLLMIFLEGMPLFYLELAIGQKMRMGSVGAWTSINPYLGGVGVASVVISLYVCLFFNVLNAWSFWYLLHSFQAVLPWSTCPLSTNGTQPLEECSLATPTQYFFYRETLGSASSIEDHGGVQMGQALCLLLAWLLTFIFFIRGVKSTGKVAYFLAIFPFLVLVVYLIRGLTLPGAINGLTYLFTPKLEKLLDPFTWIDAATQIFYTMGLGFGTLISFSSYNHYNNNIEVQAVVMSFMSCFTSVFVSVVTFSIYGYKATINYENCLESVRRLLLNTFDLAEDIISQENVLQWVEMLNSSYPLEFAEIADKVEICDLTKTLDTAVEGLGLSFIVFSEAISNMPLPQLWSVLYFLMLLVVGMGTMLGNLSGVTTPLRDVKFLSRLSDGLLNGLVCIFCFLLGLGFTTPSGNYWLTIFNDYGTNLSLFFVVFIELIAVSYIYGLKRFSKDIKDMLGREPNWYWKTMWAGVSPLLLLAVLVFNIVGYVQGGTPIYQAWEAEEGQTKATKYPVLGQAVIGLLIVSSVCCVPLTALYVHCRRRRRPGGERGTTKTPLLI